MFPADRKHEPLAVSYDCRGKRASKTFLDPYSARRFYAVKFKAGKQPHITRSDEMTKTAKKAPRKNKSGLAKKPANKAAKAKVVAKKAKPTKKATVKGGAKKGKTAPQTDKLGKGQIKILQALKSGNPRTRVQLLEKEVCHPTQLSNLVGYIKAGVNERECHADNLFNRGLVTMSIEDRKGKNVVVYQITAKGTKALG